MKCSGFESELTALAAGEVAESLRDGVVQRLRLHAAGCDACRGTTALLALLALPAGERDLVADPGRDYWGTFDERLAARIAQADMAPSASSSWTRWRGAAAAAVGLIGLIGGSLWFWSTTPGDEMDLTWLMAQNLAYESSDTPVELPGDLAAMLDELSIEQAVDALGGLAGLEAPWDRHWVDLDDDYDAVLGAVDDLEQLTLLEDWLPTVPLPGLAVEAGLAGISSGTWSPFPDAHELDGTARKELLRWLFEQDSPAADLS